jgi:hypothetical protein
VGLAEVVVVVTGGVVIVVKVLVEDDTGGLPVALAARTDETEVHAGFLLKLES